MLDITVPFLKYFFIKLSNYIAYGNMDTMMPNSLGQGHISWSVAPFVIFCLLFGQNIRGQHMSLTEHSFS